MAEESLGIGTEAQQAARLSHLVDEHGFELRLCPACQDRPGGCETCDGMGCVFKQGSFEPCGPACLLLDVRLV